MLISQNKLDVIKYEGDNENIVHKSEIEDFNSYSFLVVNESQEALFYKDGQALDLFPSGRHELVTDRMPFLKGVIAHLFNKTDSKQPFSCEVFFVNKVNVLEVIWGTDMPITLEDPKYHLIIGVRSNGSFAFRVKDTRKFVVKVAGQLPSFQVSDVTRKVKTMVIASVKDILGKTIINSGISILDINGQLSELSNRMKDDLNAEMNTIGLEVTNFYINTIAAQDNDLAKLKEQKEKYMQAMSDIDIEAIKTVRLGEAMAKSRAAQGYTYQDERRFDVMQDAASNTGGTAGTIIGAGVGFGVGAGVGAGIGVAAGDAAKVMTQNTQPQQPTGGMVNCPNCGTALPAGSKFCMNCGAQIPQARFCPNCGNKLDSAAKFCMNCGTKIS